MGEKLVPKRQYTEEFKTGAVRLALSVGQHEAARRLGVPATGRILRHDDVDEPTCQCLGHSVYDASERLPNLTQPGIGPGAFALTCRFVQSVPRVLPGPRLVT